MFGIVQNFVADIRDELAARWFDQKFVIDKTGKRVVEIVNASFVADEDRIFGAPSEDYIKRELDWYMMHSLNVNDIPGGPPTIWREVADKDGFINSNYGWCVFSRDNGGQYYKVLEELQKNPLSRRAIIIYTRPSMWKDYNLNGRSDFMCTNTVQYLIRENTLDVVVNMRSNDVFAGYRNDYAWQKFVAEKLATALGIEVGDIYWNVGSLHLYEEQFYLAEHFWYTGQTTVTKKEYKRLKETNGYPED